MTASNARTREELDEMLQDAFRESAQRSSRTAAKWRRPRMHDFVIFLAIGVALLMGDIWKAQKRIKDLEERLEGLEARDVP